MPNVEKDNMIDLPSDGPDVEVTLPVEPVKEGAQEVAVPEVKPEGEVEVKEEAPKEEAPKELIQEAPKEEAPKEEAPKEEAKELEEYGEGVKKRIAKLTKRMRESERQRDEATRYARTVIGEQKTLKDRLSKLDTGYVSEMESRITSGLEAAKGKLTTAREAGNINDEVDAQKEIAKLGYEEARLAEMKVNQEARKPKEKSELNQPTNTRQEQPQRPRPDARATEWAGKNQWFGSDNAMTYTAFDMHKKLVEEEGYDPQSEDYYGELDRRIKLGFPHKFGNVTEQTTKPTQTVASATRSVNNSRKTVRLTPSQVTIAKKLGVPLELYAKQLNITKER